MKSIKAARALAALAVGVVLSAPCIAAPTPTAPRIVENVDEPARNPFQQSVGISGPCNGPCNVLFSAVPVSKTLRITYASCFFSIGDTGGVRLVYLTNGESTPATAYIPANAQGNAEDVIASAELNLYSSTGTTPVITIDTNTSPISNGQCTISGYTVNVAS
jgi:hypothetical protein